MADENETLPGEIVLRLDVMLALRKVTAKALAEHIGLSEQTLSVIRRGKAKGMRFSTLVKICDYLDCQPGDLLEYRPRDDRDGDTMPDNVHALHKRRRAG